jgi:hypothetical protein
MNNIPTTSENGSENGNMTCGEQRVIVRLLAIIRRGRGSQRPVTFHVTVKGNTCYIDESRPSGNIDLR